MKAAVEDPAEGNPAVLSLNYIHLEGPDINMVSDLHLVDSSAWQPVQAQ